MTYLKKKKCLTFERILFKFFTPVNGFPNGNNSILDTRYCTVCRDNGPLKGTSDGALKASLFIYSVNNTL